MDYRHHWHDVLVGAILGLVIAFFSYRQYYPSLTGDLAHRPYAPRIKREEDTLPFHHRQPSGEPFGPGGVPTNGGRPYQDSDDSIELADGAVPRRGPGGLQTVWKQGDPQ